jgi:hypothetical protein
MSLPFDCFFVLLQLMQPLIVQHMVCWVLHVPDVFDLHSMACHWHK